MPRVVLESQTGLRISQYNCQRVDERKECGTWRSLMKKCQTPHSALIILHLLGTIVTVNLDLKPAQHSMYHNECNPYKLVVVLIYAAQGFLTIVTTNGRTNTW